MSAKKKKNKVENVAGLLFVGCMFVGAGLGFLFNNILVGGAIGMGAGFLVMAIYQIKYDSKKN